MERYIVNDVQVGLFTIGMERPCKVTISTFDFDTRLFMTDFYDPQNTYDIWYWYLDSSFAASNLPTNVTLHQLEKNHAKFWYIEDSKRCRLVVTSANMTVQMTRNCMQSFVSVTADKAPLSKSRLDELTASYTKKADPFFRLYGVKMDMCLYSKLVDKLVYNIPNRCHGIEHWLMTQDWLLVDTNNATLSYLPMVAKTVIVRVCVPSSNKVIAYYSQDKVSEKTAVEHVKYSGEFHYKLYYTRKCTLVSSNNFSYNHKNNYELGILIYD